MTLQGHGVGHSETALRGGYREFRREEIEQSIPARFQQQVAERPDALAVLTRERSLSYDALNRAADRLAAAIRERSGDRDEPVALLLEQGVDAVIAILAVLKAGKIFLPVDPTHPLLRLTGVLDDAGARLLVTEPKHAALASRLANGQRIVMLVGDGAGDGADEKRVNDANRFVPPSPGQLACLFYTSGSTGRPKGVVDTHRNVLHNAMRYTNALRITPSDRLTLVQSPTFSGTLSSLFCALLNGATICPFNLRVEGFASLAAWLAEMEITVYHSVPVLFRSLLASERRFPSVRVVRLEGDRALPSDVALFRRHFGRDCILAIGLGATETGLSCQYRIDAATTLPEGIVPVGRPMPDMDIVILDDDGRDVGREHAGEIAVRSRYLALGYWRQPELTRVKFRPDPNEPGVRVYSSGDVGRLRADGCLEILGRKDPQSKIHGQWVDAAEVEAALARIDDVREAVVLVREAVPGEPRLVAYVVVRGAAAPTASALRALLAASLPDVMIPSSFVFLDALPVTENGKVDRRALPAPEDSAEGRNAKACRTGGPPPRDGIEHALVAIWEQVLRRRPVDIHDDFFDLGGDSLLAARMALEVEKRLGKRVSPAVIYATPTIAGLAAALGDGPQTAAENIVVALRPHGTKRPVFFIHDHLGSVGSYVALARHLGEDQPCFGLQSPWLPDPTSAPATIEAMAARYVDEIRRVQPTGPYHLAGACFGGVVAFEVAQQLVAKGDSVALLAIIAVTPYDFPDLISAAAGRLHALHGARARLIPRLEYYATRLRPLSWPERLRYLGGRGRLVPRFLRDHWREIAFGPAAVAAPAASSLVMVHSTMFQRYRPSPFAGRLGLFLSTTTTARYSSDPGRDWQGLAAGGVDVYLMDAGADVMAAEPHARKLAMQIRRHLGAGEQPLEAGSP